jgi:hypothetical protein
MVSPAGGRPLGPVRGLRPVRPRHPRLASRVRDARIGPRNLRWRGATLAGRRPVLLPEQLAGRYELATGHVLYPPPALLAFAVLSVLPAILWWLIPLGIVGAVIAWHRPALLGVAAHRRLLRLPVVGHAAWTPATRRSGCRRGGPRHRVGLAGGRCGPETDVAALRPHRRPAPLLVACSGAGRPRLDPVLGHVARLVPRRDERLRLAGRAALLAWATCRGCWRRSSPGGLRRRSVRRRPEQLATTGEPRRRSVRRRPEREVD